MKQNKDTTNQEKDIIRLGILCRAKRKELKLSQTELAKRSGLTLRAIGKLERGEVTDFHASTLKKLCIALNLSADFVLFGPDGWPSKK